MELEWRDPGRKVYFPPVRVTLEPGVAFPPMDLSLVEGGSLRVPEGLGPGWGVLLFYRGHF